MVDEVYYKSSRFWTYSKDSWEPSWWEKIGFPYFGCDEWGRQTIVVGFWFIGYLVWAYRTCWSCQDCHAVREQTYRSKNYTIDE